MCVCFFLSHIFYCCYKPLPLHWAFAVLWSFPFFVVLSLFFKFNFLNLLLFCLYLFLCLLFLLFFSPCSYSLMYINLLHLPLFNFAYLFFLFFIFFLSFPLNIFVSFVFVALFPTWHLTLVLFSSLCFS